MKLGATLAVIRNIDGFDVVKRIFEMLGENVGVHMSARFVHLDNMRILRSKQCRIAARAECAIAQGPDLLGGPVGPPTSAYLHESMALKPE